MRERDRAAVLRVQWGRQMKAAGGEGGKVPDPAHNQCHLGTQSCSRAHTDAQLWGPHKFFELAAHNLCLICHRSLVSLIGLGSVGDALLKVCHSPVMPTLVCNNACGSSLG